MGIREEVLRYLTEHEGEVISGTRLGTELHATRNAVWKAVCRLRNEGYAISAGTNRGYCYTAAPEQISAVRILRRLRHTDAYRVEVLSETASTNLVAKQRAEEGEREGLAIIADRQTQGRGRLGRSFFCTSGWGIYVSVLLRPKMPARQALSITTAAAVAAARAIGDVFGVEVGIKWVNDLYWKERKVCGILTEAAVEPETDTLRYVVVGFGINVAPPQGGFPAELSGIAGALTESCDGELRSALAAALLDRLYEVLSGDRAEEMAEYRHRSVLTGRTIRSVNGAFPGRALVLGVNDDAELMVRMEDGTEKTLSSGEVSVRADEESN